MGDAVAMTFKYFLGPFFIENVLFVILELRINKLDQTFSFLFLYEFQ